MSPLVFRTAIPFGYALFAAALLVLATLGIALLWHGARRSRPATAILGVVLLCSVAAVAWANVEAERGLDLNPDLRDRQQVTGLWRDGHSELELRDDGAFVCRGGRACADLGPTGKWKVVDFEIVFEQPSGASVSRRVVRYRKELRLTQLEGDPDTWGGHLTFRRVAPGS